MQGRVQELIGEQEEPEPGRVEKIGADLKDLQGRTEGEAKETIGEARARLDGVRKQPAE